MADKGELLEEIIWNTSLLPLDRQEHILHIVKAMAFSRRIMKSELEKEKKQEERGI